ncbi:sushi, von Willebrand factor type A, EGF and pentraxin domain-containing protein 1-like isoform X2 [Cololabis saira]|uniref:sushi, von Willebrand factor type A, EGF and pentraxin domain-containing protein 1-like isoform X2 n=1 Tax=Cololabis saira TaxID=129043 RepID=UPI002AD3DB6E|nr:sushi, von Willebrand factor type A, EGF and pentraxin domain-containing protein 1-like isoform X2 [Cololabis saira]
MRSAGGNILLLSFAFLATAQDDVKCPTPAEFPHTRLQQKYSSRPWFHSGEKVYYNCLEDFSPARGSRSVQCVNGTWSKLTLKCEKKSCGNAGDLPNGQFHYEGNTYIGEKVYAECNKGFTLKGMDYMICKKSGWTGEFPSCEEGAATCSTPVVHDAVQRRGEASVHQVGESMNFTCRQGFQLEGAQQITCGPGGLWQPQAPRCRPSPDKTQHSSGRGVSRCGAPPSVGISNAHLADKNIAVTSFASGKLCGNAGEIQNGQFEYTGIEFGDTATAVCNDGYVLVGKATRTCMNNGWDGRVPDCEVVTCVEPEVTNAERKGLQEPPYLYRSALQFACRQGTLVGPREIWCTKDGTWSASPPQCQEITCPSPNVRNGFWMGARNNKYQPMDTISVECKPGYIIAGPRSIICSSDGRWLPQLPRCLLSRHNWRG